MLTRSRFHDRFQQYLQALNCSSLCEKALEGRMGAYQVTRLASIQRSKGHERVRTGVIEQPASYQNGEASCLGIMT